MCRGLHGRPAPRRNRRFGRGNSHPKIKELVPTEIGIIAYYAETNSYRVKKESSFREISHELKEKLLYDAMKKWVDKFSSKYFSDFT